jgi:hypothetical protein
MTNAAINGAVKKTPRSAGEAQLKGCLRNSRPYNGLWRGLFGQVIWTFVMSIGEPVP